MWFNWCLTIFKRHTKNNVHHKQFQPSPIASALGTVGTALGTYERAKGLDLFSKEGGPVIPAEEGTPGGLRGIMIKIIRAQRGKGGDPRSKKMLKEKEHKNATRRCN